MPTTLRLLILEDEPNDAELEIAVLEEAGYRCQWNRVQTREDFLACLDTRNYDLILSDYSLPGYDGLTALNDVLERNIDIPVVVVSGTLGEELAIETLKAGATDYVLKNRISRLVPVVKRALKEQAEYRQRQQAEKALRVEKDKLESVLTAMDDGVYICDQDYNIQFVNPVLVAEFGPYEGRKCYSYFHDREDVCSWCKNSAVFAGKTVRWEWTSSKNGKTYDLIDTPLKNTDGSISKLEMFRDVTDRKQAEKDIASLAKFPAENPDPVLRVLSNGTITYANPASGPLLSRLGSGVGDALPDPLFAMNATALSSGSFKQTDVGHSGRVISFEIVPIVEQEYVNWYGCDVTERRRAREELAKARDAAEAANRAKSEFLATMSHEIRTPLTAVIGFADLLIAKDRPRAEELEYLQTIRRNAENLVNIISDILDLSKIEAEKIELELSDCSAQQIAEDVASTLSASADQKQLKLEVEFVDKLPKVIRTDPDRLRQILLNLVGNAIKFTDSGEVRIAVSHHHRKGQQDQVQFAVTDTGIGINAEGIDRLFKPFTQVDMSHTRRFGGTGLGLVISQKLASMLGGTIEVQSEPSRGSTFTLLIVVGPVNTAQEPSVPRPASFSREKPSAAPDQWQTLCGRVLLVEDDPDMQDLMTLFLQNITEIEVDLAENGGVGYEKAMASEAKKKPYDLILMDTRMPVMDGHETTRRLRADGWQGPIVAVTAHAMASDREKCLAEGCNAYLSKPVNQDELLSILTHYLDRTPAAKDQQSSGKHPITKSQDSALFDGLLDENTTAELIQEYAAELPDKVAAIENAFRTRNFQLLTELVHKLKGIAGMYGFPQVSQAALAVKHLASEGDDLEQLRTSVAALTSLCCEAAEAGRKNSTDITPLGTETNNTTFEEKAGE